MFCERRSSESARLSGIVQEDDDQSQYDVVKSGKQVDDGADDIGIFCRIVSARVLMRE